VHLQFNYYRHMPNLFNVGRSTTCENKVTKDNNMPLTDDNSRPTTVTSIQFTLQIPNY